MTEEATEVLLAAKDDAAAEAAGADRSATRTALAGEAADLLYHALVLLAERGRRPGRGHRRAPIAPRRPRPSLGALPPDLAATLADPDVEPLPGDRLRDVLRVGHPRAVDRHAAARDHPPRLAPRGEQAGLGQQDRDPPAEQRRIEREPAGRLVERGEDGRVGDRGGRELGLGIGDRPGRRLRAVRPGRDVERQRALRRPALGRARQLGLERLDLVARGAR